MTSTAILLAAALGAGQLFPDQPTLGGPCPACPPCASSAKVAVAAPCCAKAVAKPGTCCDKSCPCPADCPNKKTADVDYSFLLETLDAISDTADFLGDVVSALWPFQTYGPYYDPHAPVYYPSPAEVQPLIIQGTAPAPVVTRVYPSYAPPTTSPYLQVPQGIVVSVPGIPVPAARPTVSYAPVAVAVTPSEPATPKTTIKLVQSGEHHVLAFTHGDATLVSKKTMVTVGGQDLMFTAGATRVHVHGRTFEASATTIRTYQNTLVLDGDVHFNGDDHGNSMFFKGSMGGVVIDGDQAKLVPVDVEKR